MYDNIHKRRFTLFANKLDHPVVLFAVVWVFTFILYLPAAEAGFVSDFTGWLDQVKNHTFLEDINRTNFHSKSLYQVTQLTTYVLYYIIGINPWLWHIVLISLHALNVCLLYRLFRALLVDAGIANARELAIAALLLFCVSPYISETIVWEPSFHFLTGLLFILLILRYVQRYIHTGNKMYPWLAALVYIISTHTLEIFYITPWLVLVLALYYLATGWDRKRCMLAVINFYLPLLIIFILYLLEYRMVYHEWIAHIGTTTVTHLYFSSFGKPFKYLFHLLLLGRFFPDATKNAVLAFLSIKAVIAALYGVTVIVGIFVARRFSKMSGKGKVCVLLSVWIIIFMALMIPLWFPEIFLIRDDRYTYFSAPFIYMLLVLLISYLQGMWLRIVLLAMFALVNLRYTIQVNRYWMKSAAVVNGLLDTFEPANDKIVLLLNLPDNMHGASMISATPDGEFNLMLHLLRPEKVVTGKVYDVVSYNMLVPTGGAIPHFENDSTIRVVQTQPDTWWWYNGFGATSYENKDYRFVLNDGHTYTLVLRHPSQQYALRYSIGGTWYTLPAPVK